MERREILKYTAYATGAAISLPLMSTLLSGCKMDSTAVGDQIKLTFFSQSEIDKLKIIVDSILPKTDSPSASEVGVHHLIDSMVGTAYQPKDQEKYRTQFNILLDHLHKQGFQKADESKRLSILKGIGASGTGDLKEGYQVLRQQTIAYYLSTEEIGKNYLNYLPVPGIYEACISLESVGGKAWVG